jgi:hypothetical protein
MGFPRRVMKTWHMRLSEGRTAVVTRLISAVLRFVSKCTPARKQWRFSLRRILRPMRKSDVGLRSSISHVTFSAKLQGKPRDAWRGKRADRSALRPRQHIISGNLPPDDRVAPTDSQRPGLALQIESEAGSRDPNPRQAQEKAPLQRGQISPLQLRFWNCGSCRFPSVCKDNSGAQGSFRHIPPQFCRRRIKGRGPAMAKRTAPFVRWFESVKANQWALIALAPAVPLPSPLDRSPTYGAAVSVHPAVFL